MKVLVLLFAVSLSLTSLKAQVPVGAPVVNSTGRAVYGYPQSDSAFIAAKRDTLWFPRYKGSFVYWQNPGVDSCFWVYNGNVTGKKWDRVVVVSGSTSPGTGTVTIVTTTDTYGFTSTVTNPTTTPNITSVIDTTKFATRAYVVNWGTGIIYDSNYFYKLNSSTVGLKTPLQNISINGNVSMGGNLQVNGNNNTTGNTNTASLTATGIVKAGGLSLPGTTSQYVRGDGSLATGGVGTLTSFSLTSSSGITSSVISPTSTPTVTLSLGAITPTSVVTSGGITASFFSGDGRSLGGLVKYTDTAVMLSNLLRKTDTANMLSGYARTGSLPVQYWQRTSTTLSPITTGDNVSTSGYFLSISGSFFSQVNPGTIQVGVSSGDMTAMGSTSHSFIQGSTQLDLRVRNLVTGNHIVYFQDKSYTVADSALTMKYTDTASMLTPYLRKSDTASMLTPFVQYSDTAFMLSNLLRKTDTLTMLTPYLRKTDTASMLSGYARIGNITSGVSSVTSSSNNYIIASPTTGAVILTPPTNVIVAGTISATGLISTGQITGVGINGTITTPSQSNITLVGTLTALTVSGNITTRTLTVTNGAVIGDNLTVTGRLTAAIGYFGGVTVTGDETVGGTLTVTGKAMIGGFTTSSNGITAAFNSLNSNGYKISLADNGVTRGFLGASAANPLIVGDATGIGSVFSVNTSGVAIASGISFTGSGSVLSYYQEGMATITATTTTGTVTLNDNVLTYTRIGNTVFFSGFISVTSVSSPTGTLTINGLPFASANNNRNYSSVSVRSTGVGVTTTALQGYVNKGTSTFIIEKMVAGAASGIGGDISASSSFIISGQYSVN